jgi:tight adherence protein B
LRWYALAVFTCLALYFLASSVRVRSRVAARRNLEKHLSKGEEGRLPVLARLASRLSARLDSTVWATALRDVHSQSASEVTWESFRLLWFGGLALLPLLSLVVTGSWLSVPPTFLFLLAIPRSLLPMVRRRNERKAREQCERLASDLALYLQCGIPVADSLELCSRDLGPPLSEALARFQGEVVLGADSGPAFLDLAGRLDNQDLQLIAQAAVTSRETGADIRQIMGNVGDAVRERAAIRRELYTQTVQGRLSGRVVAGLPFLFLGLSALMSRATLSVLLGTVPGLIMLIAAAVMDVLGFLWIRKILDIKA